MLGRGGHLLHCQCTGSDDIVNAAQSQGFARFMVVNTLHTRMSTTTPDEPLAYEVAGENGLQCPHCKAPIEEIEGELWCVACASPLDAGGGR